MNAIAHISRRSLDQLENDLISLSSHMNAMEYEFLVLVREFDLRAGWKAYSFNNCADRAAVAGDEYEMWHGAGYGEGKDTRGKCPV